MLIFRYLAKEVLLTLVALTTVLMLVFMSNQFVLYLNRAASGQFPVFFVLKLMALEMPTLLCLLLPLGFYVALLVSYGRLYCDNEMTVLKACGFGPESLLRASMVMAVGLALFLSAIVLWGAPYVYIERTKILRSSGVKVLMQTIAPGQFRAISGGKKVYFVESMDRTHGVAQSVFLAQQKSNGDGVSWDILWADKASLQANANAELDYMVLENGHSYHGVPGELDYQVVDFERFTAFIPQSFADTKGDVRTAYTSTLWPINNRDPNKAAEIQWRISVPLMLITLTLIGVPLSRVDPRSGKYSQLFPALLIYLVYANFMFVARGWVSNGKVPTWLGLWWLHGIFLVLGFLLCARERMKLS